jgi:hypothetical protein
LILTIVIFGHAHPDNSLCRVLQAIKMPKRASDDEAGSMPKKARPDGKDAIVATILEQIRDKSKDRFVSRPRVLIVISNV